MVRVSSLCTSKDQRPFHVHVQWIKRNVCTAFVSFRINLHKEKNVVARRFHRKIPFVLICLMREVVTFLSHRKINPKPMECVQVLFLSAVIPYLSSPFTAPPPFGNRSLQSRCQRGERASERTLKIEAAESKGVAISRSTGKDSVIYRTARSYASHVCSYYICMMRILSCATGYYVHERVYT